MAENAHTEAEGGGSHKFPPLQVETYASQLLWLAIMFVALYVLMSRIALPRVGTILDDRRKRIAGDLDNAKRLKDESDTALAAYQKSLADARNRAQAMASETRAKQAAEQDAARKALDFQLHARLAEADQAIAGRRTAAMANVQGIATDTAVALVERLIGKAPPSREVEAAVADVLKR